jgi:predicted DNA-binding transcriptional regulator YafY
VVATEPSPTARALLTLELVQNQPGITAEQLAGRLGVSPRAARRYVAILREAGIPVASMSGPAGGYRPGRGLRLPPLMFSADEALALVMALLDGHHEVGDPSDVIGNALGKLLRALPESVAAQAETVRRSAAPAPDRNAVRPEPALTAALVQAGADHLRVRLAYRSEAGADLDLEIEPWAVVVRHSRWYLLGRTVHAEAVRAYRIDRVRAVDVLDASFAPPADLNPVQALEEHLAAGWRHQAVLVIDAPLEEVARRMPRTLGRLEAVDAGTTRLLGTTSNPHWYAEQLAGIPIGFRVEGDDVVRAAVREVGQRLLTASGPQ